jgi:hypothetical protein
MLWDYLKTLIMLRLTLQSPCMCAGCKQDRYLSKGLSGRAFLQRGASAMTRIMDASGVALHSKSRVEECLSGPSNLPQYFGRGS